MQEKYRSRPRDEATEKIECYIIGSHLAPHTKIPSERDLCEMWGFNRTTLRSAIHRLIIEGKLYNKKGSGTFVAQSKLVRNLQDLKPLSELVRESGGTLSSCVISMRIIEANKQIAQKLHVPLGNKIFELTRCRAVDGEPIIIETCFADHERYPGFETHDYSEESFYNVIQHHYGVEMVKGEEKLGITYATEEEAAILGLEEGEALFYLTGVVCDPQEIPIEYFKSVARADKVRFASTLKR